jgi:phage regulator Rha-like protein
MGVLLEISQQMPFKRGKIATKSIERRHQHVARSIEPTIRHWRSKSLERFIPKIIVKTIHFGYATNFEQRFRSC